MRSDLSGTNVARAGGHKQRVTLHAVRLGGPVTRRELASRTGLTPVARAMMCADAPAMGVALVCTRFRLRRRCHSGTAVVRFDSAS
jgi:hypothetical protein